MDTNYEDYRTNIKSGDLLAFSHKGCKSWNDFKIMIVRMFTRSEYSHVGTAWWCGGRLFCIEAVEPCVRIFPLSRLGSFYHVPLNTSWSDYVEEVALNYVGSDYKQLHAIKAFLEPLDKTDVSECAALTIHIAEKGGIDLGSRATPDAVVKQAQLYGNPLYFVRNE